MQLPVPPSRRRPASERVAPPLTSATAPHTRTCTIAAPAVKESDLQGRPPPRKAKLAETQKQRLLADLAPPEAYPRPAPAAGPGRWRTQRAWLPRRPGTPPRGHRSQQGRSQRGPLACRRPTAGCACRSVHAPSEDGWLGGLCERRSLPARPVRAKRYAARATIGARTPRLSACGWTPTARSRCGGQEGM